MEIINLNYVGKEVHPAHCFKELDLISELINNNDGTRALYKDSINGLNVEIYFDMEELLLFRKCAKIYLLSIGGIFF